MVDDVMRAVFPISIKAGSMMTEEAEVNRARRNRKADEAMAGQHKASTSCLTFPPPSTTSINSPSKATFHKRTKYDEQHSVHN